MTEPLFTTSIPTTGPHGNIFAIIGTACSLMRQIGLSEEEIAAFQRRALGEHRYVDACAVVAEYFPLDPPIF